MVTLQAKCTEIDSDLEQFHMDWDGKWDDGDMEMERHLKIKQLPRPTRN